MPKTARIEVRTDPVHEALLKQAAALTNQTLTSFILEAAERRAEQVVAESNTTVVPSAFFDQLLDALDHAPEPNQPTRKAAQKFETLVSRQ
ncbi:MAG: type II toxin-antitoxin system TacA family antitoxin [Acidimicrobiales bacterium]